MPGWKRDKGKPKIKDTARGHWSVALLMIFLSLAAACAAVYPQPDNTYAARGSIRRSDCELLEQTEPYYIGRDEERYGQNRGYWLDACQVDGQLVLTSIDQPWMGYGILDVSAAILYPQLEKDALNVQVGLCRAQRTEDGQIICDEKILLLNTYIRDAYYEKHTAFRGGDYAMDSAVWLDALEHDQLYAVVITGEENGRRWLIDTGKVFKLLEEDVGNISWQEVEHTHES